MQDQKIRIRLQAYDHRLLDHSSKMVSETAKQTGAVVSGPVPLPTRRHIWTVQRATFINKKSREQFEMRIHSRLIDIAESTPKTFEALQRLELPSGVDFDVKIIKML